MYPLLTTVRNKILKCVGRTQSFLLLTLKLVARWASFVCFFHCKMWMYSSLQLLTEAFHALQYYTFDFCSEPGKVSRSSAPTGSAFCNYGRELLQKSWTPSNRWIMSGSRKRFNLLFFSFYHEPWMLCSLKENLAFTYLQQAWGQIKSETCRNYMNTSPFCVETCSVSAQLLFLGCLALSRCLQGGPSGSHWVSWLV